MKNFTRISIFQIVLLLGIFSANAQNNKDDYYPLVEEGKIWIVSFLTNDPGTPFWKEENRIHLIFLGDTIMNEKLYSKIYHSYNKQNPTFPNDWSLAYFMREDEDKKVWLKQNNPNSDEQLYYDFSLQVGDPIPNNETIFIEDITYETMENGEQRKTFWLSEDSQGEFWIEGMGSSRGIVFSLNTTAFSKYLLKCYYENEVQLFYNQDLNSYGLSCEIPYIGLENYHNNFTIKAYPNPVKDILYIQNTDNLDINCISLINNTGQVIEQYQPKTTQINISNKKEGLYFIKFSTYEGDIIQKIVIEK